MTTTGSRPSQGAPAKKSSQGGGVGCLILSAFLVWAIFLRPSTPTSPSAPVGGPSSVAPVAPATVLLDLSGNGIKKSRPFTVTAPWTLGYDFDCSAFGMQGNFIVSVYGTDGTLADVAVNEIAAKGHDTTAGYAIGELYLDMNSECSWAVRVTGR